jgi:ADP-ribose pyrophosphatase
MDASADVAVDVREVAYDGHFKMERLILRHRRFAGGWTRPLLREVFVRGPAVAVLPYDPWRDEVVLIEQFRAGALVAGRPAWMVEIVAGVLEPGEGPEAVARRETREEAGIDIQALEPIAAVMPSPGACSEWVTLYCARVDAAGAEGIHGLQEEGEDIRVIRVAAAKAATADFLAGVDTAVTLIALQWLALHRDDLRRRWAPPGGADALPAAGPRR